jgi:3-hydroxyisobutyrate dehydrogenase-like beta-hydroxyacid dehydrogenase
MIIGVIGLGAMGKPMARNLAKDGDSVVAFDINEAACAAVAGDGIVIAPSAAAVAAKAELIVSMVSDDDALAEVVFGSTGVLQELAFDGCLVDLSTTSVQLALRIGGAFAARPGSFLDAAVIGGSVEAAREGRSPIVIGGERTLFDRHAARLARLGSCDYVGKLGNGKVVKLLNNLLVGILTASNAEALSIGLNAGLELPIMVEHLTRGSGGSTVLQSYMGRYVREGIYGSGLIGHDLIMKDLRLACELAEMVQTPAFFTEAARQTYAAGAMTQGDKRQFPSIFDHFRTLAGFGRQVEQSKA